MTRVDALTEHPGGERAAADDPREESELERLDRNTVELLNELRVAAVGIQVMFAFLLVVPFNTGWKRVTKFDRYDYYVTLLCIAVAAVLIIAPSIHHRLLFRLQQKEYIVTVGTKLTIAGMGFLTVGFTGILVLIANVVFGATTAAVTGSCAAILMIMIWFVLPIRRRIAVRGVRRAVQRGAS